MNKLKSIIKKYQDYIIIIILFILAFTTRIIGANNSINIDAAGRWLPRINNFWDAIKTLQIEKIMKLDNLAIEGISTLWQGTFFIEITGLFIELAKLLNINLGNPETLILVAKLPIIIVSSIFISFSYILFNKIFENKKLSFLICTFLLIDPVFLYESKDLHLNAMMTSLALLGFLYFIIFLKFNKNKYLIFSGIFIALALLTRSSALIFAIFLPSLYLYLMLTKKYNLKIKNLIIYWCLTILIILLIFWPNLWIDPIKTIASYLGFIIIGISTEHEVPNLNSSNLIKNLYYLIYSLVSITIPVIVLFLLLVVDRIKNKINFKNPADIFIDSSLFLIAFYYIIFTIARKSSSTYILPAFTLISVLAAIGLYLLIQKINKIKILKHKQTILAIISLIFIVQIYNIFSLYPTFNYRNLFFDLLKNTPIGQSQAFFLGRGEGYKEAVEYFRSLDKNQINVSSWYSACFKFFITSEDENKIKITNKISDTDYLILHQTQIKRGLVGNTIQNIMDNYEPEKIIEINNIQYLWIYKNPYKE